jgi:Zn finger protein HypA/HybF involved in hydrogenase expression
MSHSTREDVFHYRVAEPDEIKGSDKYNLIPYLAYCQYCKYQIITKLAGARCIKCDSSLIKFIAHNELAGSDS